MDPKTDTSTPAKPRVLICDDDPDTRAIVRHALEALGYFVTEATDGAEAKCFVEDQLPDLIVMDIMMPQVTGTDFVEWFRSTTQRSFVPILLLTALSEVDDRVEGLRIGADDYLVKPFHYRELQARVEALLRIKNLTESLEKVNTELLRTRDALVEKERELVAVQLGGAAAHNLGQPLTTLVLHANILEGIVLQMEAGSNFSAETKEAIVDISKSVQAMKVEAKKMTEILKRLKSVDAARTAEYLGEMSILDLGEKSKPDQE